MLGTRAHRRWWLITRCAARRLKGDNIPLLAAGVAFYGFLALFPMLIAAALAYGLVADPEDVGPHVDAVADALPSEAEAVITDELESITAASNGAIGLGLVGAAIGGLWTVTTGMKGLITATNVAYERRETRSFLRLRVLGAGLAVASIGFGLVATTLVAVIPAVADAIGIGTQNRILVELFRWPLLAGLILVALATIYRIGPDRPAAGFRLLSLGAITGSLVWIAADVGFSVYVDNFSRYANTYGSLAGVVVLMLWLYVSAFIVLLGAEINAEAERFDQREVGRVANSKDDRGREEWGVVEDPERRSVALPGNVSMPLIGFGTWQLRGRRGYDAVRYALEVGYRHLDTATIYGNEAEVGRALRDSGVPRREVFITTKLPPERAGRERRTLAESLDALGVDYVDLWLIHWPPGGRARPQVWREFIGARADGLVKAIGVSNYSTAQIDELIEVTGETPAVNQIRWAPARYDPKRAAEMRNRGVVLEGYSPFKSTDLSSPTLVEIADRHGVSTAQVVLRWHLEHGVVAIPKSATPERITSNLNVFGFSLSAEEVERIDSLRRA